MSTGHKSCLIATTASAIVAVGIYLYYKRKQNRVPTEWKPAGEVKNIYIYPLKSGHSIELQKAECTSFGLQQIANENGFKLRDRCFIVYKERTKEFITARTYPKMIFITVAEHSTLEDHVAIDAANMRTLYVRLPREEDEDIKKEKITMWHDEVLTTLDCGDEAASWLSRYIYEKDSGLRLGYYPASKRRDISKSHTVYFPFYKNLNNESTGMYSDLSSYMVINENSVDELNSRLTIPITHQNFRPNIVVQGEGIPPYAEDQWTWVKIGDAIMRKVKPCTRCTLTTVDPKTGIRRADREPIKTLETYRRVGEHLKWKDPDPKLVAIGINLGLIKPGVIEVHDIVYVPK